MLFPKSPAAHLVDSRAGVRGCGKPNAAVGGVEYRIETLKECVPVNEVEPRACGGAQVSDDEVDAVGIATNRGVEGPRPDLCVGCELVGDLSVMHRFRNCMGCQNERFSLPR